MARPRKGEEKDRPKHIGFSVATWVYDGVQRLAAEQGMPASEVAHEPHGDRAGPVRHQAAEEAGRRRPGAITPYKIPSEIASRESLKIAGLAMPDLARTKPEVCCTALKGRLSGEGKARRHLREGQHRRPDDRQPEGASCRPGPSAPATPS